MKNPKKAISITLLMVMLISTFAALGMNPVSANNTQESQQLPTGVYYVDGNPYVPMDQLKSGLDLCQNVTNTPLPTPKQAHLDAAQQKALASSPEAAQMLEDIEALTISVETNNYPSTYSFSRDSTVHVMTAIQVSGGGFSHYDARLIRQVIYSDIHGNVVYNDPKWIATQQVGNDWGYYDDTYFTPDFSDQLTLYNLYTNQGPWHGNVSPPQSAWEGWDITVVYRIEIQIPQRMGRPRTWHTGRYY